MDSNNSIDSDDHRLNKDLAPATRENPRKNLDSKATKVFLEEDEADDGSEGGKEKPKTPAVLEKEKELDNKEASENNKSESSEPMPQRSSSPTGQTINEISSNGLPPPNNTSEPDGPIPKKVKVRVQRIVTTKSQIENLTNQGLLEMRDGNLILKCPVQTMDADGLEFELSSDEEDDEPPEKMTAASRTDFDDAS